MKVGEIEYAKLRAEFARRGVELSEADYKSYSGKTVGVLFSALKAKTDKVDVSQRNVNGNGTEVDQELIEFTGLLVGERDVYGKNSPIRFAVLTKKSVNGCGLEVAGWSHKVTQYDDDGNDLGLKVLTPPAVVRMITAKHPKYGSLELQGVRRYADVSLPRLIEHLDKMALTDNELKSMSADTYPLVCVRGTVTKVYQVFDRENRDEKMPILVKGKPVFAMMVVSHGNGYLIRATMSPRNKASALINIDGAAEAFEDAVDDQNPSAVLTEAFYGRDVFIIGTLTKNDLESETTPRASIGLYAVYEYPLMGFNSETDKEPAKPTQPEPAKTPTQPTKSTLDDVKKHIEHAFDVLGYDIPVDNVVRATRTKVKSMLGLSDDEVDGVIRTIAEELKAREGVVV